MRRSQDVTYKAHTPDGNCVSWRTKHLKAVNVENDAEKIKTLSTLDDEIANLLEDEGALAEAVT